MINEETLNIQQTNAPTLKKEHIRQAVELAEETVIAMASSLPHHIKRDDGRSVSGNAHWYWLAYFWYRISTGEEIGAGFGYDLRQWGEEASTNSIPPWRVYLYLYPPAPHHPKPIQDIRAVCETKGYLDRFVGDLPTEKSNSNTSLWIPIPKEFIRGLTEAPLPTNVPILLAGAVNAFLGNIMR